MIDRLTLQLVPTEALITELLARCDHGVIALMRCGVEGDPEAVVVQRRWKGNTHTCAGLGFDVARAATDEWERRSERSEPPDPEEPDHGT